MKLSVAQKISEAVVAGIAPWCDRVAVAGSVRRQRPECGDIDIVALPKNNTDAIAAIKARCLERGRPIADGHQNFIFNLDDGTQVDIFFAHHREDMLFAVEPANWGTMLLCRTGSKQHNIYLADRARKMGLHWAVYRGLMDGAEVIVSETEEEIFDKLQLKFREPTQREMI